jgi:hypothetical protein
MHDESVLVEAIRLRLHGTPVKEVARKLGVSVGWASETLSGIRPRKQHDRRMLEASQRAVEEDRARWHTERAQNMKNLRVGQSTAKRLNIESLKIATAGFTQMPSTESTHYKLLDRLQQAFVKDPGKADFGLIDTHAPRLYQHLVAWRATKHGVTQDKSDARFVELAQRARDHVAYHLRPPSLASTCQDEIAAARWLSRWISNARGSGERRKNLARSDVLLAIAAIVEGLRSKDSEKNAQAVQAIDDGRWAELFDQLIRTAT